MRWLGAIAGLALAFTFMPPPVSAQPTATSSSGWRTAASAALAFGHAEGKAAALMLVAIPTAPASQYAVKVALERLDRAATDARASYAAVELYGSPYWTVAAEVRVGDMFACQAERTLAIFRARRAPPIPAAIAEALAGLADPIRNRAIVHWDLAAAVARRSGIPDHWFVLLSRPGC